MTWSKVNGLAHEKPVNGLFANSPFYGPLTYGPLGPKGNWPNNVMWAVEYNTSPFHFRPMYGPRHLSAHMRPSYLSALYRPTVTLAHNEQYFSLYPLTARDLHGPFPACVSFRPIDGPYVLGLLFVPGLLPARYWPVPLMGQIRPMARVGPLLACSPNGPNPAHGKSRPVTGPFP